MTASCSSSLTTGSMTSRRLSRLDLLEEWLRSAGYETQSVQSGARALEVLSSKMVSAVLLDLLMPGMDGFAMIRHIRKESTLKELPIFVITGKTLAQEEIALLARETQALVSQECLVAATTYRRGWKSCPATEAGKIGGTIMTKVLIAPKTMPLTGNCFANCGRLVDTKCLKHVAANQRST
jgi:CheY-like chemotaxis protein